MQQTCDPILVRHHPMPPKRLSSLELPSLDQVFADFRSAQPGQPVGLSLTVIHRERVITATGPASILVSQGPSHEFEAVPARDALRHPKLLGAMDLAIYAPSMIQDMEEVHWMEYGWKSSSEMDGYHLRTLWIFPGSALLMDNIHECFADMVSELSYLALVMFEPPQSNHSLFGLSSYIDDLLKIASTAAVPDLVSEWPEELQEQIIPFASINPSGLG